MTDFAHALRYTSYIATYSYSPKNDLLKKIEREGDQLTIYLDAVWILNFLLDMMLLMLTKSLIRDGTPIFRIVFGAFIASLIVPVSVFFPDALLLTPIGKLLFSIIIMLSTFKFISISRMLKQLLLFYFITFAIGGGLIGVHYLFQQPFGMSTSGLVTMNQGYGDPISWLFIIFGFPVVWIFTKKRMDNHAVEKIKYDQLYPVTIEIQKKCLSTTGYIDSGNQLTCPMTKKPVIICDQAFLKQWFTDSDWQSLQAAYEALAVDQLPENWQSRIQIIPYQGVEGTSNFLFAIRPEQLTIYYDGERIITKNVLIGIQFGSLVRDNSYHCLLQPQIFKLATVFTA